MNYVKLCWKGPVKILDRIEATIFDQQTTCVPLQAPLDRTTASPQFVALPTSDSSADSITEPARGQPERPSPVSVLDLPFQEESLMAMEFKELSSDLEGEIEFSGFEYHLGMFLY